MLRYALLLTAAPLACGQGQVASITGEITGQDGRPISEVFVEALRLVETPAGPRIERRSVTQTNSEGRYQLRGISPGPVVLKASFPTFRTAPAGGSYETTYYPDAQTFDHAAPVEIQAGENKPADFKLREVPTFHVRGRIYHRPQPGSREGTLTMSGLSITPCEPGPHQDIPPGERPYIHYEDDGSFDRANVAPGTYCVEYFPAGSNPENARETVTVTSHDIDRVVIDVAR